MYEDLKIALGTMREGSRELFSETTKALAGVKTKAADFAKV